MPPPNETLITSRRNPRVQDLARLRERRHRERQGRTPIDGAREILRAINAGVELTDVVVSAGYRPTESGTHALEKIAKAGVPRITVSDEVFGKIAFGDRAEGILAVAKIPETGLEQLPDFSDRRPLFAVLEGFEKPGNVGAVCRAADAAGVSALLVADGRTDLFNPNAIRASLGAIFGLPLATGSSTRALAWLRERKTQIVLARVNGATRYTDIDFTVPTAMVFGSEALGLSDTWQGDDLVSASLPMRGAGDSLNVSAAATVFFYEALRQREAARAR